MFKGSVSQNDREYIDICQLTRGTKQIQVCYTFYAGNQMSHRLQFKRGRKVFFELFLDDKGRILRDLVEAIGLVSQGCPIGKEKLSRSMRLFLQLIGRKIETCSGPLGKRTREYNEWIGTALYSSAYFVVKVAGWLKESVILLRTGSGTGSTSLGSSTSIEFDRIKLYPYECMELKDRLEAFLTRGELQTMAVEVNNVALSQEEELDKDRATR